MPSRSHEPPVPPPPSPAAVAAFLRGLDRRARLFAAIQSGQADQGGRALAAVARVFSVEAAQWPLAQWPSQYWRLLLTTPALRHPVPGIASPLPGIARLPPDHRAAVLLHLVASLSDDDAADALGVEVHAYQALIRDSLPRNGLGQPDVDVWRAWRAAIQRELERVPEPPPPAKPAFAVPAKRMPWTERARNEVERPAQGAPWLWLGVVLCVVAFTATFFIHPAGREAVAQWFATIKREPLPPAATPKARFDARDPTLHPDRELLASPSEAALADQLAFLAWLVTVSDPAASDAVSLPDADGVVPAGVIAPAEEGAALARRMQAWAALPLRSRGMRRGHWQAWRDLAPHERVDVRKVARRLGLLPEHQQRALRERFAAQPYDARTGWWLGPRLGRDWPRVAALFAFVDEGERASLLRLLREASAEDIDALARLAQSTAPEDREALRRELLARPQAERGTWLQARLQE